MTIGESFSDCTLGHSQAFWNAALRQWRSDPITRSAVRQFLNHPMNAPIFNHQSLNVGYGVTANRDVGDVAITASPFIAVTVQT
jgi:hypothetical protein